ncbi:MAG: hypothetical protein N2439_17030, partial [Anaerolineae bacterium]|nr:hypothetical protein [Anaerolineae bacterium]
VVARLKRPPPNIRDIDPKIQPETAELIERMMAPDPVLRYPTSASLLADMRRALAAAREAKTRKTPKKKRREWSHIVVLGGAAVFILGIAIYAIHWFSKSAQEAPPAVATRRPAATAATGSAARTDQKAGPEGAPTQTTADTEGVVIQQTEGGRVRMTVVFFEGELEAAVVKACANLAERPAQMVEEISALSTNVPANSARQMWLRVFQALPLWVQGEAKRADELLRQVAALPLTQRKGHPVYMPQTLALYLIGDLNEERFANERKDWPVWYGDLAGFFVGVRNLFEGEGERAIQAFETYVNTDRAEPAWAYGFRPAARKWLEVLEKWENVDTEASAKAAGGDLD